MSDSDLNPKKDEEQVENGDGFTRQFNEALGNPEKLWEYVNENEEAETVIRPVAWELIGATINYLRENSISEQLPIYEKCLEKITEFAAPKEVYLGILEQFDPSIESKYVELLIPALSNVLEKLSMNDIDACITVLETTFSTLSYYLESLNIPTYEEYDPTAKRTKIFEAEKIERFIEKYIDLLNPVIDEVHSKRMQITSSYIAYEKHCFQFLCSLLVILGQIDIDEEILDEKNGIILKTADCCQSVMLMLSKFHSPFTLWRTANWYRFLPTEERSAESKIEVEKHVDRARACYVFLLLCRGLNYDQFPKVYSSRCLFTYSCIELNTLISYQQNQCVVWKGLEILTYILKQTSNTSISCGEVLYNLKLLYGNLEGRTQSQNPIFDIFNNLIKAAVTLSSRPIRSTAIQHVTKVLNLFHWEDKYTLLMRLLRVIEHEGARGILIGFLKDRFDEILRDDPPKNSEIFCEPHKISTLGEMIFLLPQGAETDLLEDSNRLMPALNLLRFILIRDKNNKTGILDHLEKIDKKFLKPLRDALDLSRAHFENELKKFDRKAELPKATNTEFVVSGTPLPSLSIPEQKQTLESALHMFDMIEIVTVRVIELVDAAIVGHSD